MTRILGRFATKAAAPILSLALAASSAVAAADKSGHDAHHHPPQSASSAAVDAKALPRIKIVAPAEGAKVKPSVAVEFETTADLSKMTMGGHDVGIHLHVDIDGTSLMPSASQLSKVGAQRYRFVFDLPAAPGKHVISVYWSDARHRTIESTVQRRQVVVVGEK